MIPELGSFALMLAFCVALLQGVVPIAASLRNNGAGSPRWMALARPAAYAQAMLVTIAFACLVHAFVVNDFSVLYVASHSNTALPLQYRISAVWGGHEGSLLLWVEILVLWTAAVALLSRQLPAEMLARVLGVMGLISVGFLAFTLWTSNPFERLLPAAVQGQDLNPLLQDIGMIAHPPLLYMGYVGFSVAFAFAIAALIGGQLDAAWARWSRPWTLVAWSFMTLGIFLGSFWAYYELGWGGWWFWDAVENASFMPWLVGTALIHSLAVTEKRGSFKNWTVLLAIMAFALSLLGTFLVRSGVLTSVHAFATDPSRGLFILVFLALVVGGSLLLYAWRAPKVGLGGRFAAVSRESMLLANNVLLVAAAGTVLLGTLYPLFLDALDMGKISVGPPYFETVFVPLMAPMLLLLAAGPFLRWKQAGFKDVRSLRWVGVAAVLCAIAAAVAVGSSPLLVMGLTLAAWILLATVWHLLQRLRVFEDNRTRFSHRLGSLPGSYWGMLIAHAGIGVFVIGVTLVKGREISHDVPLQGGDVHQVGGYDFRFVGVKNVQGPNYSAVRGTFEVTRDGKPVATLSPEKRQFASGGMPMTEAAINRGPTRDLYLALGEEVAPGKWVVRIQHKPFVAWIWSGALLIGFGGLLAALDKRYRLKRSGRSAA
jgi:cytochrome c-type biogenesis protein CcmF